MPSRLNPFLRNSFAGRVRSREPLARHTTLGVGGTADYYIEAVSEAEAVDIFTAAREQSLPVMVLGQGSNVVIADGGWPGVVMRFTAVDVVWRGDGGTIIVDAQAGVPWDELVAETVRRGLTGIECLSGVPGLVGATPIQNVGCYGQEVAEVIESVAVLDLKTGERHDFSNAACGFRYRTSHFKDVWVDRYLVTAVRFRLEASDRGKVGYADVEREFSIGSHRQLPTVADVREAVLAVRRRKSMIIDADNPNHRSVGSFFLNVFVSEAAADDIEAKAWRRSTKQPMPRWPTGTGDVKLSAAWLVEAAGLRRGQRAGAVGLSTNHTLAIVNLGGATAEDVVAFARMVRERVRDSFGVTLEPEPRFLGFTQTVSELLG